jgi:hypothetical protein
MRWAELQLQPNCPAWITLSQFYSTVLQSGITHHPDVFVDACTMIAVGAVRLL